MAIIANGVTITKVLCNGVDVQKVICNGVEVFTADKTVAKCNWKSSTSTNIIAVQNVWSTVNSSYVTNSKGVLTFSKACTISIKYTIKALQMNYYCITQGHIRHNNKALVSLGGIYWSGETISASDTITVNVSEGDTIDFYGCADYYDDDTSSYLSANITITEV